MIGPGFTREIMRRTRTHYRLILLIAAFLGAAWAAFVPAGPHSGGRILWQADHETGDLSQWFSPSTRPDGRHGGGIYNSGVADVVAAEEIARSGRWSARLSIGTPGGASSAVRLFRWSEPRAHTRLRYRAWYYFPQQYAVANYWNVFQWKSVTAKQNDPFFVVNVGNRPDGTMYLYLWDWQNRVSHHQSVADVPVQKWFKIEAEYHCDPGAGSVTVWQDEHLLFSVHGIPTRYEEGDCQWAVTDYSNGVRPEPAVIYVDDAAILLP
jgi:hypothetical protein